MKLKIGYQRKKVSQVMMKESERLAVPDSLSNGGFSSRGNEHVPSLKSRKAKSTKNDGPDTYDDDPDTSQDEVLVENLQETVSCIFYPYKHQMQARQVFPSVQIQKPEPPAIITHEVKAQKDDLASRSRAVKASPSNGRMSS
jgi:hypothetical protein